MCRPGAFKDWLYECLVAAEARHRALARTRARLVEAEGLEAGEVDDMMAAAEAGGLEKSSWTR